MVEKSCQLRTRIYQLRMRIYIFCYDARKLKKKVKFYVPTWTPFAGPVTLYLILEHSIHTIL